MNRKLISLFLGVVMAVGSVAMLASCTEKGGDTTTLPPVNVNPEDRFLEKLPADLTAYINAPAILPTAEVHVWNFRAFCSSDPTAG